MGLLLSLLVLLPMSGSPPPLPTEREEIPVSINKDENGRDRCMSFNLRVLRRILGGTYPRKTFWFDFEDGSVKWQGSHLYCLRVKAESRDTVTLQFNSDALQAPESSGRPPISMEGLRGQFKASSPNADIQWCS